MSYHILVPGKRATKTRPLIERLFTISCDNCIVNRFGLAVNTIIHIYEVSGDIDCGWNKNHWAEQDTA